MQKNGIGQPTTRRRKGPAPVPVADRFWPKVNKDGPTIRPELGPCWVWTATAHNGYGYLGVGGRAGRPTQAHRVSWTLHYGPIPEGLWVLHRCDNPPCVNPAHLFLGTVGDNNRDMYAKGRAGTQTRPHAMVRGAAHHRSKLTDTQIQEIRAAYAAGGVRQKDLAAQYGVYQSTIGRIIRRNNWTHVP